MEQFNSEGLDALSMEEMSHCEGGFLPALIYGAALLVEVAAYAAAGDLIINFNSYNEALKSKMNQQCGCNKK